MRKVLLICVGSRDPFWDLERYKYRPTEPDCCTEPGPILDFLQRLKKGPDEVHLISTAAGEMVRDPTWQGGERTQEVIQERWPELQVCHWPLDGSLDPTDHRDMLTGLSRIIEEIGHNQAEEVDYWVNVSPGTPQMEAAWISMVHAGVLRARLFQILRGGEIREVDLAPLFEGELRRQGMELYRQFSFRAASSTFQQLSQKSLYPRRREGAQFLADLMDAYHHWDLFNYGEALKGMQKLLKDPVWGNATGLEDHLRDQKNVLDRSLSKLGHNQKKLFDLYHSAHRAYEVQGYTECIWRCGAVVEQTIARGVAREIQQRIKVFPDLYRFRESLQEQIGKPEVAKFVDKFYGSIREVPFFLGIGEVSTLLKKLSSPFLQVLTEETRWVAKKRGDSLHRLEPVSPEDAKKGLEVAERTILSALRLISKGFDEKELHDYPFSVEALWTLAEPIQNLL